MQLRIERLFDKCNYRRRNNSMTGATATKSFQRLLWRIPTEKWTFFTFEMNFETKFNHLIRLESSFRDKPSTLPHIITLRRVLISICRHPRSLYRHWFDEIREWEKFVCPSSVLSISLSLSAGHLLFPCCPAAAPARTGGHDFIAHIRTRLIAFTARLEQLRVYRISGVVLRKH
jgi:hypothetical protein